MDVIHGFKSELLIGISGNGEARRKQLDLRKSSGVTEACLANDKFAAKHPFQWMGRIIATLCDSIGDDEVFEAFRQGKYKKLPPAVLQLPLRDVDWVFFLGHIHTHGPMLEVGDRDCPECRRKNKNIEIDLRDAKVKPAKMPDVEAFSVLLQSGFVRKPNPHRPEENLGYMGKPWNHYTFRPPTLADAIRNEAHYSEKNRIQFNMRVYHDALLGVESWERGEGGEIYKLAELEESHRQMEGMELFDALDGQDRALIRGAFLGLPGLDLAVDHECDACGEDIAIQVDPTSFHPLAKEVS